MSAFTTCWHEWKGQMSMECQWNLYAGAGDQTCSWITKMDPGSDPVDLNPGSAWITDPPFAFTRRSTETIDPHSE